MTSYLWAIIVMASSAFGSDWAQWRGPSFNGSSDEQNLPSALDPNQTLLWKTPLPGKSSATPVISAGKVYLPSTEAGTNRLLAMCLDVTSGRILWTYAADGTNKKLPSENTLASCSACAEADGATFMFGDGTLVKLDSAGTNVWKRNLVIDYGPLQLNYGYSSSPLLLDGRLYIPVLRSSKPSSGSSNSDKLDSYLLCVNAADGKINFKQNRPTDALEESASAYITPIPIVIGGRMYVVIYGGDCVTGHDPHTGKELWRHTYVVKKNTRYRQIPTPVAVEGILVCAWPRGDSTFGLNLDKLVANEPPQVWILDQPSSDVTSAAVYQGNVYQISEYKKTLSCLNPKNGNLYWTAQLDKTDVYYASITAGDGKLYIVNRKGVITVAAADPTAYRIFSTYHVDEKSIDSSLAIADGKVFLRTAENLYCFSKK